LTERQLVVARTLLRLLEHARLTLHDDDLRAAISDAIADAREAGIDIHGNGLERTGTNPVAAAPSAPATPGLMERVAAV
jgi:hypothetical protein